MKTWPVMLMLGMVCSACASLSPAPARTLLDEADAMLAAEDYRGALALYAGFVQAHPDGAQAARARATRTALERLFRAEADLERLRRSDELPRLRRDLSHRQSEVDRLKAEAAKMSDRQSELDRLKAEMAKLRSDLERLRSIDLQELRAEPKK